MNIARKLARVALSLVTLVAGCGLVNETKFTADYGIQVPPKPHDATVTLYGFSYAPPSPVHPGDILVFTAATNKPTDAGWLAVTVGDPPEFSVWLNDIGIAPDDVPGDGIWHGEHDLPVDAAPAEEMPTTARLTWEDGAKPLELAGKDLTILEGGE